ncbi:response regulator [Komagataeibacter saccharivorans]|uniref:response regulator n=1 Tax=Komagataeibacter saccharivorans TaxID=265959 RepID=UPI002156E40C|nr:response regulator [Komagataeibacter saccharivorans]GBQ39206.1 two component sensor histidine kinase [Komagataeibacter saccharivorans NRIC 0614]
MPLTNGEDHPDTLLLVEDSDTQALRIRRMLEGHGFHVHRVASGEAALDTLDEGLPGLVIADYHLPGMNGGQLARQLRMNAVTRTIPVLILTEGIEPGLEREGLESGADAYIPKSSDPALIVFRIRALLREHAAHTPTLRPERVFRRARIMVIAPEPARQQAVPELIGQLRRDGHIVTLCHDPALLDPSVLHDPEHVPDCVVIDLACREFDGLEVCRRLDEWRQEDLLSGNVPLRILGVDGAARPDAREFAARVFEAGIDDLVSRDVGPAALALRIRVLVRRKLLQDDVRRIETERQAREIAVKSARAEAAAIASKASLAEALEQANRELADANHKLIETQAKLVQTAKMASLGELVAGIAHEINNPLAFILAHKDTVARGLDRVLGMEAACTDPAHEARETVLTKCRDRMGSMNMGLRRIQNLVLNLRKFSRLDEGLFQLIDVPEALETVMALLTQKLGSGIVVRRRYEAPERLYCQAALLNQVIMNIISNAADAILAAQPDDMSTRSGIAEGEIDIHTFLTHNGEGQDSYVFVITDSGPGIPPDVQERIFEPFFTTKPVGAGTGLGLAIAYSVVQAHHGSLSVGTAPQGGARFTISVPWNAGPGGESLPPAQSPAGAGYLARNEPPQHGGADQ